MRRRKERDVQATSKLSTHPWTPQMSGELMRNLSKHASVLECRFPEELDNWILSYPFSGAKFSKTRLGHATGGTSAKDCWLSRNHKLPFAANLKHC